jgi:hypothetical protein
MSIQWPTILASKTSQQVSVNIINLRNLDTRLIFSRRIPVKTHFCCSLVLPAWNGSRLKSYR